MLLTFFSVPSSSTVTGTYCRKCITQCYLHYIYRGLYMRRLAKVRRPAASSQQKSSTCAPEPSLPLIIYKFHFRLLSVIGLCSSVPLFRFYGHLQRTHSAAVRRRGDSETANVSDCVAGELLMNRYLSPLHQCPSNVMAFPTGDLLFPPRVQTCSNVAPLMSTYIRWSVKGDVIQGGKKKVRDTLLCLQYLFVKTNNKSLIINITVSEVLQMSLHFRQLCRCIIGLKSLQEKKTKKNPNRCNLKNLTNASDI